MEVFLALYKKGGKKDQRIGLESEVMSACMCYWHCVFAVFMYRIVDQGRRVPLASGLFGEDMIDRRIKIERHQLGIRPN